MEVVFKCGLKYFQNVCVSKKILEIFLGEIFGYVLFFDYVGDIKKK